jgi:hypothetical protein
MMIISHVSPDNTMFCSKRHNRVKFSMIASNPGTSSTATQTCLSVQVLKSSQNVQNASFNRRTLEIL